MNMPNIHPIANRRLVSLLIRGTLAAFIIGYAVLPVQAQDRTLWTNVPAGGLWSEAANWDNGVPNLNQAYLTNSTASYTVTNDAASPIITNLTVMNVNASGYTTTLEIVSGGSLILSNAPNATLATNSVLNVNSGGTFTTRKGAATGALNIYDGAQININGGAITNNTEVIFRVGIYGYGTLTINSGRLYSAYGLDIGAGWPESDTNSVGSLILNNGTVQITGRGIIIGKYKVGRVVVNNGSFYSQLYGDQIYVGTASGYTQGSKRGFGVFDVYGGTVTNEGYLRIAKGGVGSGGYAGPVYALGTVTITNGAWVQQADVFIGETTNDVGALVVTNQGVFNMFGNGSNIYVGVVDGQGALTMAGGQFVATNSTTNATVFVGGSNTLGRGTMNLSGGTATVNRILVSPYVATGTLDISRGRLGVRDFSCTNGLGYADVTFRMDGTANGTVAVTNAAALAGNLTFVLTNLPTVSTVYQLFTWGAPPTGAFSATNVQGLTGHYRLDCGTLYTDGSVTLVAPPSGVFIYAY